MSEHLNIDNECPEFILWEQYKKSEPIKNYFSFLTDYFQTNYFDNAFTVYAKALGIYNSNTEFLQFFSKYFCGINRPVDITNNPQWNYGYLYNNDNLWSYVESSGFISITAFRLLLLCILDWTEHDWNIEFLYKIINLFCGTGFNDILIEQDTTDLNLFTITIPSTDDTVLFKSLLENYKSLWNFPAGISFEIILTT